jgi:hypothetical protein
MFAVHQEEGGTDLHVLVSDDLVDAPFCCNLSACRGACCVQGDAGAPLEHDECARLEEILPAVRRYLRPEALSLIEEKGVWEEVGKGQYATTCVDGAECVFVTYDGRVAKCAIQKAHDEGRIDFPKPVSCHLFPVRVESLGGLDSLNYEQVPLCSSARGAGRRSGVTLSEFLRAPLIRKYGEPWYEAFRKACADRRERLDSSRA